MLSAVETRELFGISYWDAAIIEAARALGCDVVLSEDLSDGQDYAGVSVENPFDGDLRAQPARSRRAQSSDTLLTRRL